jgi:glycosyltransferase involved in cell wall biosynthesis
MQKKILYIGNKPSAYGGTTTTIETLAILLKNEGFEVYTASSVKNKLLRFLDMLFVTLKYQNKVDLVLIDTYSTLNFYYAVWVAKLCRILDIPYIPILHGGNLPKRLIESPSFSRKLFGLAKTNVAPSKYLISKFEEKGYDNLLYIPNSIEINEYTFLLRNNIKPKMLWVRSFSEIYNPLLALKILKQLLEKGIEATLCMIGPEKDGSLAICKQYAIEHKLPVTFTGKLKKNEWISISKEYDLFLNTTNFDNMPVTILEAMALGFPIISTNVGGTPFLIDNYKTGILVNPNNEDNFVEAISELLANPLLVYTLSENARNQALSYNWEKVKPSWLRLINDK